MDVGVKCLNNSSNSSSSHRELGSTDKGVDLTITYQGI